MIQIPTLAELQTQVQADLEASFDDTIPSFGKNFLRVFSGVIAGLLWLFYKGLGFIQKNIFVDTADPESAGGTLERWGRIKLGRNPFPARAAKYNVQVVGTIGATIPAQTTFKSNDDSASPGMLFILDEAFVLTSSPDQVIIRALEPGLDSRLNVADGLTTTAPIANVDKGAVIVSVSVEPLAAETIEEYRTKTEESFRTEPQGGAPADYRIWASDVQGVAKVYPYAKSGAPGEINIYVEATTVDSIDGKGTPSSGMLAEVADVIELDPDTTKTIEERGRRPLGVFDVHELAVSPKDVDIEIADFISPDADKQALIESSLDTLISSIRPFISGADVLSEKNDVLNVNKVISAILSAVPNADFGTVTLIVDGSPVDSITFNNGDIPWLNSITYT